MDAPKLKMLDVGPNVFANVFSPKVFGRLFTRGIRDYEM
jgi:hypothetical protein